MLLLIITTSIYTLSYSQKTDFWDIDFYKADSIASRYDGHDLKNLEKLAESLAKGNSTDPEKFRSIFRWITDNIKYDYQLYLDNEINTRKFRYKRKKQLAWRNKFSKLSRSRTLKQKVAVCSGYSMLLEYMSSYVGIQCVTINGYGRTLTDAIGTGSVNHAWNAVLLNNKWYLCDPTWASGYVDHGTQRFYPRFNRNYFLTDPSLFIANHFPADTAWTLLREKPTLKEFLNAPIRDNGYLTNKIVTYSPREGILKCKVNESVGFKFTSNSEIIDSKATVQIKMGKDVIAQDSVSLTRTNNGEFRIEHCFDKKGRYSVIIFVNTHMTFLYNVIVT